MAAAFELSLPSPENDMNFQAKSALRGSHRAPAAQVRGALRARRATALRTTASVRGRPAPLMKDARGGVGGHALLLQGVRLRRGAPKGHAAPRMQAWLAAGDMLATTDPKRTPASLG